MGQQRNNNNATPFVAQQRSTYGLRDLLKNYDSTGFEGANKSINNGLGQQSYNNTKLRIGEGSDEDSAYAKELILANSRCKAYEWANSLVGSQIYARNVSLRNISAGHDKCNIFVADGYTIGAGINNYPRAKSPLDKIYPASVDRFLNCRENRLGSLRRVDSPQPGDIAVFPHSTGGHIMIVGEIENGERNYIGAGSETINKRSHSYMKNEGGFQEPTYWRYDGEGDGVLYWEIPETRVQIK